MIRFSLFHSFNICSGVLRALPLSLGFCCISIIIDAPVLSKSPLVFMYAGVRVRVHVVSVYVCYCFDAFICVHFIVSCVQSVQFSKWV